MRAMRLAGPAVAAVAIVLHAGPAPAQPEGPAARLEVPGAASSGVSIAARGEEVVATWAARTATTTDVYAAWSRDGGVTFEPPVRVNDLPGDARVSGEQAPRVAFVGGGVRVVWESRAGGAAVVRTAIAAAGERAFGPTASLHAAGLTGARGWASLAAGPGGAAHVAWLDGRGDGAAHGGAGHAGGGAAHSGHSTSRQDLFEATLSADGSRTESRVATDVCFCCKTAVAAAPPRTVWVAWRHIYRPNLRDIAVARSDDGGRSFGEPFRVSRDEWALDGCPDDGPALAVDGHGVLHVAWPTLAGDAKAVFYSRSDDGGRTFAPRLRVDASTTGAAHPQLAARGDRALVAWDEPGGARRRVVVREVAADAGGAPRLGGTTTVSEGPAVYPAVAATAGAVVVAWTEDVGSSSVIRVRRLEGTGARPRR